MPVRDCVKAKHVRWETRCANHRMSCRRSRNLEIHLKKYYRFEYEFHRALCKIGRFVIFQIALAKFSKNEKLCFLVTLSSSLEAKIKRI